MSGVNKCQALLKPPAMCWNHLTASDDRFAHTSYPGLLPSKKNHKPGTCKSILLIEEILHQLICSLSHCLQGFCIPGGCLGFLNHQQYYQKNGWIFFEKQRENHNISTKIPTVLTESPRDGHHLEPNPPTDLERSRVHGNVEAREPGWHEPWHTGWFNRDP